MRELKVKDFYLVSAIADKMDFDLPNPIKEVDGKRYHKSSDEYGQEMISLIIKKAWKAEKELNQLISELMGKNVEDMLLTDLIKGVKELAKSEEFRNFFK